MTDWSQFKPVDEPAAEPGVDWSQFQPEPKPSLIERAKSLFSPSSDIQTGDPMGTGAAEILAQPNADTRPVLERPATPEQVAARPKGFSEQEMADGSVAPWKAEQNARVAAYGNTNRSPVLKAPGQSAVGDALRGLDRKPLDNSLFGAVAETAGDAGRGIAKVVPSLAKSAYGAVQAGADVVGADGLSSFARSAQDAGADWLTQFDNPNGDSLVTGAFQSLGTAIAGGSLAGVNGAIGLAVGQTAADKYHELRKGGVGLTDALEGATVHGVAEYLGERIGMPSLGRMVSGLASKTGIPPMAALKEFLKQQGEEQVTLAIQSAYDKLGSGSLRGDMTLDDYLNDVVTTAQQTAIMTAAAAGGGRIARAASTGAQQMLAPGLAARIEPPREPFEAGFTPMTDSANIAPAAPSAPAPIDLVARAAPVRVEEQPTTPMTPEQILSAPAAAAPAAPAPRVDVNNAEAVLAQLGLGQPDPAGRVEPYLPAEPTPFSAPVNPTSAQETPINVAPIDAENDPAFKSRTAAAVTARRAGGKVIEVPGGFAVQQDAGVPATSDRGSATPAPVAPAPVSPQAQAGSPAEGAGSSRPTPADPQRTSAPPVEGEPINREWTAFTPESGTLGIPRAEMPQVKAEHRGALVNFLAARGITHETDAEVDPATLKPTQAEFSPAKVKMAMGFEGGDRSILVSSDGHVLDGHHQWMAAREAGKPIKAIRLNAPIAELVKLAHEFPSSTTSSGATKATDATTTEAPRAEAPAQGAAPATEAAADVPAARPAAVEAAGKSPDVAAQVELRKRASVLKSLLDCMA